MGQAQEANSGTVFAHPSFRGSMYSLEMVQRQTLLLDTLEKRTRTSHRKTWTMTDEQEQRLWAMLDRQDAELKALVNSFEGDDRLFRTYAKAVCRVRARTTHALTESYVDEVQE